MSLFDKVFKAKKEIGEIKTDILIEENKTYTSVQISDQVWMTENLNLDRFRNGDIIPEVKTLKEWEDAGNNKQPAWCYYDNEPEFGQIYGKLYNWFAVNDPRGLAPLGWKIPSHEDWLQLTRFLGGEEISAPKIKSKTEWNEKNNTNETGFNACPGGYRQLNMDFFDTLNNMTGWWSSTEIAELNAFVRILGTGSTVVQRYYFDERAGFYVRCIKDNPDSNLVESVTYEQESHEAEKTRKVKTVKIENRVWMNENLNISYFRNGDPVPYVASSKEWIEAGKQGKPACCFYDNEPENGIKYGKLYNWYAVHDSRGLIPEGWHIPDKMELKHLVKLFGGDESNGYKTKADSEHNTIKNDFQMLPAGFRMDSGYFTGQPFAGWWWCENEASANMAFYRAISFDTISVDNGSLEKTLGFSVRCVQDSDIPLIENSPEINENNTVYNEIIIESVEDNVPSAPSTSSITKTINKSPLVWMDKNLNENKFQNGDIIPEAKTNKEWIAAAIAGAPAWCYYDNDPENGCKFGKLYNWFAVADPRGLAPNGWHIPSREDWVELLDTLGGGRLALKKLKGQLYWLDTYKGTNESGFHALPGGARFGDGTFQTGTLAMAYWWCTTEPQYWSNAGISFWIYLNSISEQMQEKSWGCSIRCISNKSV